MANVLVVGNGGREHALTWKLAQSPDVDKVYTINPNPGMARVGKADVLNTFDMETFEGLEHLLHGAEIDLTVVGPEAPLVAGLADYLQQHGHAVYGPSQAAAQLEASKVFANRVMIEAGVPHANWTLCHSVEEAQAAAEQHQNDRGIVAKFDGLASGKGVEVYNSLEQAQQLLPELFLRFGEKILVTERLAGPEYSIFAFCDGEHVVPIPFASRDYKRLLDNDLGPNTGGMGAHTSPAYVTPEIFAESVGMMQQTVTQMATNGTPYTGFLYGGFMLTEDGPQILEFNVRMGDPETQPTMMKLGGDLYHMMTKSLDGTLTAADVTAKPGETVTVVLASQGYSLPGGPKKGKRIGIPQEELGRFGDSVEIFHAGSGYSEEGVVTAGGRTHLSERCNKSGRCTYNNSSRVWPPIKTHI